MQKQNKKDQSSKELLPGKSSRKPEANSGSYGKYMGAGFQLLGPILAGFIVGMLIDKYLLHFKTPIATIILSIVMIIVSLIRLIKDVSK